MKINKIIALLLICILLSCVSLCACSNTAEINIDKNFKLSTDETISFLTMRNLDAIYEDFSFYSQYWRFYDGLEMNEGVEEYSRPYIEYSVDLYSKEFGDSSWFDRPMGGMPHHHSCYIDFRSYGFEGEVGKITYEYIPFEFNQILSTKIAHKAIEIYNDGELVAKLICQSYFDIPKEFLVGLVENCLVTITIGKYTPNIAPSNYNPFGPTKEYLLPNIDETKINIFGIRDIALWEGCDELIGFDTKINRGLNFDYTIGSYHRVQNITEIKFIPTNYDKAVDIKFEFYEYREEIESFSLFFEKGKGKDGYPNVVNIYHERLLVGQLFYKNDEIMTEEYLTELITENLIKMSVYRY